MYIIFCTSSFNLFTFFILNLITCRYTEIYTWLVFVILFQFSKISYKESIIDTPCTVDRCTLKTLRSLYLPIVRPFQVGLDLEDGNAFLTL